MGNNSSQEGVEVKKEEYSFSFSNKTDSEDSTNTKGKERTLSKVLSYRSSKHSKTSGNTKAAEGGSILGRFGKAVDVLDMLGSSMTNLNVNPGFVTGVKTKGNQISILAFEVANTIVKGSNIMESLSKENIKYLKQVVFPSEGVQTLISKDTNELLRIAAKDKREELMVFAGEVVRFGNRCKDPQFHNLDRYFRKLSFESNDSQKLPKIQAEAIMKKLMSSVQYTAELYHELHTLDKIEQDSKRKLQDLMDSKRTKKSDKLYLLKQELKIEQKIVKSLKKKSLWSRILDEVIENLVDIVYFIHFEISEVYQNSDVKKKETVKEDGKHQDEKLGSANLALHYASIISQIDTMVSRSSSILTNTRDMLYEGLPSTVKLGLRSKLQSFKDCENMTVSQIKNEMEKTLRWIVPLASNTTTAHHGFGWVGEWASSGCESNRKVISRPGLSLIETLHYASKEKTEAYILDLVVWLHHLIALSQSHRPSLKSPVRPLAQTTVVIAPLNNNMPDTTSTTLTEEDREMLMQIKSSELTPGISKSMEFRKSNSFLENIQLVRHNSHCSNSRYENDKKINLVSERRSSMNMIKYDIDRIKALDVIDRVDSIGNTESEGDR